MAQDDVITQRFRQWWRRWQGTQMFGMDWSSIAFLAGWQAAEAERERVEDDQLATTDNALPGLE